MEVYQVVRELRFTLVCEEPLASEVYKWSWSVGEAEVMSSKAEEEISKVLRVALFDVKFVSNL